MEFLIESKNTSICPWEGEARYNSLQVNGSENENAVRYYPEPKDAAKEIKGMLAFWKGVKVEDKYFLKKRFCNF